MKITEMNNLFIADNTKENFKIAVVACDRKEAMKIACGYFSDSNMDSDPDNISIEDFDNDTDIDCDYIVTE